MKKLTTSQIEAILPHAEEALREERREERRAPLAKAIEKLKDGLDQRRMYDQRRNARKRKESEANGNQA